LASLKNDVFEKDYTMECDGFYELPTGKKIRCAAKYGHGELDLEGAIEQSCNKFFITAGVELGVDKIKDIFTPAGIGRYPLSMNDGKRFSQEQKGSLFEQKPLYMADTAYASIGQGKISLSPLQAAVFVSAIANGGQVLQPYMIQEVRDSTSEIILEKRAQRKVIDKLPVSGEYIEQVQQAMRKVVVGEYASAVKARAVIEGSMELAGKTGTAEVTYVPKDEEGRSLKDASGKYIFKKVKNTWFTAIAPYDQPKYVAVCFVQGGIYGGVTCAPIVRKFFDNWEKTKPKIKSE
ncbi:MAG: penicillin-binding transpeptidase domain-containing protein, partial [Lentisphaeraceae bacterium]|nr:penicillin-binding transpeptidase domain-containing protein [Lentisphaeraceae bacterium]